MNSTRKSEEEQRISKWEQIIQDRQSQGKSIRAYCKQEGLKEKNYHYWQKRLRAIACSALGKESQTNGESPQKWTAVCLQHEPAANEITVEVGGCRIAVTQETDTLLLAKICQALKAV